VLGKAAITHRRKNMGRFTIKTRNGRPALRIVNKKSLLAFFDFQDNETGLVFKDFRLLQGVNGFFVSSPVGMPSEDAAGTLKYPEYISAIRDPATGTRHPLGNRFFHAVARLAYAEYVKLLAGAPIVRKAGCYDHLELKDHPLLRHLVGP
jgi:hypothetical protein